MKNKKILVVLSNYDSLISNGLKKSALKQLNSQSWLKKKIILVPGTFEIPSIIEKYIRKFHGVIALGCIIKGETNNFDLISRTVTNAIMQLSIKHKKPIGNGIITCFNKKQALSRRKKGKEAALAVQKILSIGLKKKD